MLTALGAHAAGFAAARRCLRFLVTFIFAFFLTSAFIIYYSVFYFHSVFIRVAAYYKILIMNFINTLLNHIVLSNTVVGTSTFCDMIGVNSNTVLEYFAFSI